MGFFSPERLEYSRTTSGRPDGSRPPSAAKSSVLVTLSTPSRGSMLTWWLHFKALGGDGVITGDITDGTFTKHTRALSPEQGHQSASHFCKTGVKAASCMSNGLRGEHRARQVSEPGSEPPSSNALFTLSQLL